MSGRVEEIEHDHRHWIWTPLHFLIGAISVGLLTSVAWLFPDWYVCSLLGQACTLWFAVHHSTLRSFTFGLVVGTISLGIAFHWAPYSIADTTNLSGHWPLVAFTVLIVWEALVFAFWCAGVSWFTAHNRNLIWLAPFLWVVPEFFWPRVFTWALAHSHSDLLPVLQIAELGGTSAVSALINGFACVIVTVLLRSEVNQRYTVAVTTALAICVLAGQARVWQLEDSWRTCPQLKAAALQVDPTYVEAVPSLQASSSKLDGQVELVVWPETSIGHYSESLTHFRDPVQVSELSESPNPAEDPTKGLSKSYLLAGGKVYRDGARNHGPYLNSALLISPAKDIVGRYVKRSLMPIGEYIPLGEQLPILKHWAAITTPLIPGDSDEPVKLPSGTRVGTLICYEDMERENSRRTTLCGAQCLVVLINGSGFEDEDALRQHQRLAMLRTIENRRAMLRCGATGLSCYISPTGRVEQHLPMFTDGQIVTSIPLIDDLTFYTRYGEWFTWLSTVITLGMAAWVKRNTRSPGATTQPIASPDEE